MRLTNSVGNHASEGVGIRMRISVGRSGDIANTKWLANLVTWDSVHREQGNAARMTNGQGHLYDDTKYPTGFSLYFQTFWCTYLTLQLLKLFYQIQVMI